MNHRRLFTMMLLAATLSSPVAGAVGCRAGEVSDEDASNASALSDVDDLGLGDALQAEPVNPGSCGSGDVALTEPPQIAVANVPIEAGTDGSRTTSIVRPKDSKELAKAKDDAKAAGKSVVLVFGATTCLYCKKLLAGLTSLPQRPDVVVIYVEVDTDTSLKELGAKLKIEAYPTTFVVPPEGKAKRFTGCEDEAFVNKLLPSPKSEAGVATPK